MAEVIDRSARSGRISGDDAFRLYDTYGFPLDLTLEAAADAGLETDVTAFERLMQEQRERSRGGGRNGGARDLAGRVAAFVGTAPPTAFVGYDELSVDTRVTAYEELPEGDALVKLERSPFYPQGGGQVSDAGEILGEGGRVEVLEAYRLGDDQALRVSPGGALRAGGEVRARVPPGVRHATQANHTATHLLNWALRERLGTGVRQAGSYVGPDKLRFDFTHTGRVPAEELERIEQLVNQRVAEDAAVTATVMPRDEADRRGAIGLFEEKYGDRVRVLETGDYSKELCGGTHVSRTGEIGPFKIVSETSTGAGARRIEAVTGQGTVDWYRARERALLEELAARDERIRSLETELKRARSGRVDVHGLAETATEANGVRALAREVEAADMEELLALSDRLKQALGRSAAVVLGAAVDDKAMVVANFGDGALDAGLSAVEVVRQVAPIVGGGGGGKPGMARAGGKDPSRLADALAAAEELILGGGTG
jgi:alanyl-tRNA synthetase